MNLKNMTFRQVMAEFERLRAIDSEISKDRIAMSKRQDENDLVMERVESEIKRRLIALNKSAGNPASTNRQENK